MKVCKLCGSTYGDRVDFCFRDGQPLVAQEVEAPADAPTPARHAPGLADMLDVPEPAFVQRPKAPDPADPTALPSPAGLEEVPTAPVAFDFADAAEPGPAATPDDDIEVLTPPAQLVPPTLDAPVPPVAVAPATTPDPTPSAPQPVAPEDPFPSNLDSTAAGLSDTPVPPVDLASQDDLPGPREIDEGLDSDAMADIARTLSAPATAQHDAPPPPDDAAGSAPALDDLVDESPVEPDGDDDIVSYIGAEGSTSDAYDFDDDEPVRGGDNKLVLILFAAAILLAVAAGGFVMMNKGDKAEDPLAGKPEEVATPVVEAPAPPPPEPVVDEAAPTADGGDAVAELADDGAATQGDEPTADSDDGADALAAADEQPAVAPASSGSAQSGSDHDGATHASSSTGHSSSTTSRSTDAATTAAAGSQTASAAPSPTDATDAADAPDASSSASDATADISSDSPWETPAASGRLTVNTVPGGAQVSIDGRAYGSSPLSAELEYGMHTIRVELGGYTSEARTIDVEVPEMAVPFELKPLVVTGTVNIFGPTGSTVLVDGTQVGKIPTSVKLTEGTHTFRVETSEGTSFTRSQDVRFDSGTTVSVTLSP